MKGLQPEQIFQIRILSQGTLKISGLYEFPLKCAQKYSPENEFPPSRRWRREKQLGWLVEEKLTKAGRYWVGQSKKSRSICWRAGRGFSRIFSNVPRQTRSSRAFPTLERSRADPRNEPMKKEST